MSITYGRGFEIEFHGAQTTTLIAIVKTIIWTKGPVTTKSSWVNY